MPKGHWPPPGFPLVEGTYQITEHWTITLPAPFCRRVEEGSLVLWRPGLTIWLCAWNNDDGESRADRARYHRAGISPAARDVREDDDGGLTRLTYRLRDGSDAGPVEAVYAFVFSDEGHLQLAVYFDALADEPVAYAIAAGVIACT